ncbi:MAG: NAD-dependent epimerase/dehydratase family protein [Alphaproteobacteria bacterium]|nr:NAD-dependent epimerase/dehydratase family protein [Alphaproteobacteria bacterium]
MTTTKVVVCGATGFIGRNIATALARTGKFAVTAVRHERPAYDLPGVRWLVCDLRDPAAVMSALAGADVVVQAAATTSGSKDIVSRPHIHITDNAVMNSYLLRACHDLGVGHFIFFSCSIMYSSSDTPQREEDFNPAVAMQPNYFGAGWTKVYVERMCEFYARLGRTRCTVIRHSNIYGPFDKFDLDRSHVLGATVTKVMSARDGKIAVWGTGEEARDFLYVDDLVDFVERAIERPLKPFALFNCGAGRAVSIKDLVARVIRASGRSLAIEFDRSRPTIPFSLALDCAKAAAELGWSPRTDLDDGLKQTVDWWRNNPPRGL